MCKINLLRVKLVKY